MTPLRMSDSELQIMYDVLSPRAWELVEQHDQRCSVGEYLDLPDPEGYVKARYEFTFRVLIDIHLIDRIDLEQMRV